MVKRSLIIKILAGVFAVSAVSTGTVMALKNSTPKPENEITAGYTLMSEPPADGSLPSEHTGMENLSYMAYNLRHAAEYRTEAFSTVTTKVGFISYTQQVETYKDYADGVMIADDIAKSSLVNSAMQTCFVGDRVLWRGPASSSAKDWQGRDTEWAQSDPSNYSETEYMRVYGLPSTEFSVYVLNENTVADCSPVTDNGDGTYTQTFYADTETAGQYYVRRMKTMGGLSDYPSFNSIEITYTFDGAWNVLSSRTVESYAVNMGVISSDSCNAVTEQTYFYGAGCADISDYDDFFSRYVDRESEGEIGASEPTAADYLSAAFAPVLTGPVQFDVSAELNNTPVSAKVYLDMGASPLEVRARLGDAYIWYTDGKAYLRLGQNTVCASASAFGALAEAAGFGGGDLLAGLDLESLLSQLSGGELQADEHGAVLTSELEIAGMRLPLTFSFAREDGEISLNYVALTEAKIGEYTLSARLSYDEGAALPALTAAEKSAAVNLDGCLAALATADGTVDVKGMVKLTLKGTDLLLRLNRFNVDLRSGIALYAEMRLEVLGTAHDIKLSYDGNELCAVYGGIGVRVRADETEKLAEAFSQAYEKISSRADAAAAAQGSAAENVIGWNAVSALFSSEQFAAFLDSLKLVEEEGVLKATFRLFSLDAELSFDGEKVSLCGTAPVGEGLSFNLTAKSGAVMGKMPVGIDYVTADELCLLCDYAVELFELSQRTEWNIGYAMTVNNEANGVNYNVDGRVQIALAQAGKSFAAALDLAIVPADASAKSYYISFTVSEGRIYIVVSYYKDSAANPAEYNPLRLQGELACVADIAKSLYALVGSDLSFLQDLLTPFVSVAAEQPSSADAPLALGEVFRSLSVDGQKIALTLDLGALGVSGAGELTATLARADGDTDGNFILSLDNVSFGSYRFNARMETSSEPCAIVPHAGEYIDFSSVSGLIDSILSSFLDISDGNVRLLDGYYFGGKITGSIGGMNVSFDVAVNLIFADGDLTVNASISAGSKFAVNSGAYKTYLTLDVGKGMVYMMREQYEYYSILSFKKYDTPVVTYRSMTLEEFAADYWNQIVYVTNMGDTLASVVQGIIDGSSDDGSAAPSDPSAPATPKDVGSYLKGYSYADNVYHLTLNGSNFADFLGDLDLFITCNDEGEIVNIAGSADIYVTLSLDLDYENVTRPAGDYSLTLKNLCDAWAKDGYETVVSGGHTSSTGNLNDIVRYQGSVTLQNGGAVSTIDVVYGQSMSALQALEDTSDARFMGWYTGENGTGVRVDANTIDDGFSGKTLYAYWSEKITVTLDAGEGEADASFLFDAPEYMWERLCEVNVGQEGLLFTGWYTADGVQVTEENIRALLAQGNTTLYARYREITELTLYSDLALEGYTYDESLGVYYQTFAWAEGEPLPSAEKEGYVFLGWWYADENGVWLQADPAGIPFGCTELKAMWLSESVTVNASFSASGKTGTTSVSEVVNSFVSPEIAGLLTVEERFEYTFKNNWGTQQSVLSSSRTESYTFGLFQTAKSGTVTATVTYALNGIVAGTATGAWQS